MISSSHLILLLSEAAIAILGALVIYVGIRAYRRNRSTPLLLVSIGFVVIVASVLIEQIFLQLVPYSMVEAHMMENVIIAAGLLILVYSIYGMRD